MLRWVIVDPQQAIDWTEDVPVRQGLRYGFTARWNIRDLHEEPDPRMFLGLQCDDPCLWPDRQWKDAYNGNWKHSRTLAGADRHRSKGLRLHLWGTREQEKTVWVQSVLSQSAVLGDLRRWIARLTRLRNHWQGHWKEFKDVINSRREKRHDQDRKFEKRTC